MDSDLKNRLDQIDHKLQVMIENSYVAKLDLMLSVLLSLTIFSASLLLANLSMERNILLISIIAFFPVLVYILIGEAYSILRDDVVTRFGFWLVLASDSLFLGLIFLYAFVLTFFPFLSDLIVMASFFLSRLFGIVLNGLTNIFLEYLEKFPTRFPKARESYGREIRKVMKPMLLGVAIYIVTFLGMLVHHLLITT